LPLVPLEKVGQQRSKCFLTATGFAVEGDQDGSSIIKPKH
jgi:hypothetical protein